MNHGQWLSNSRQSAVCECFKPSRNNLFLRPKRKHTKWNNPMARRRRSSSSSSLSSWGGGRGPKQKTDSQAQKVRRKLRLEAGLELELQLEMELELELGSLRRMWQTCFGRQEKQGRQQHQQQRQQEVGELPQGPREGVKVVNKTKKGNAKRSPERGRSRRWWWWCSSLNRVSFIQKQAAAASGKLLENHKNVFSQRRRGFMLLPPFNIYIYI